MMRESSSRWRGRLVWATSIALTVMLAVVPFVRSSDTTPTLSVVPSAGTTATSSTAETAASTEKDTSALEDAIDSAAGNVSVSIEDLSTGKTHSYGAVDHGFDTASIVKVDILSALLLQAQDAGRGLTSAERSLAARMIENSDNTAATTLFNAVGGKSGLEAANARLGLTETQIGTHGYWGLTQTTSADQIRLLAQVFTGDSVLTAESRAYIRSLMGNVISSQRFGVSVASEDPADAELKVGFLQRSATGLWVVNSIGLVESGGHSYLVAVLSDGNTTYDGGVALVDAVAKAAVETS